MDNAHATAKVALSAIPMVGGSLSESFDALIGAPISKRREQWMIEITNALNKLTINYDNLSKNDEFVSNFIESTLVVIKNNHKEKKEYLKTIIIKSAKNETPINDWSSLFIRYIDEVSYDSILLLSYIYENKLELKFIESYEDFYEKYTKNAHKEVDKDYFKFMCTELSGKGLLRISNSIDDFSDIYVTTTLITEDTDETLPRLKVTSAGKEFIKWIIC